MADVALCAIEDVETELAGVSIPMNLVDFTNRHIEATSDHLRMLYRRDDKDLDLLLDGDANVVPPVAGDVLLKRVVRDAVARNVASEVSKKITVSAGGTDVSSFSQFSEGAGGYTFSGTWAGVQMDIWFSDNQLKALGLNRAIVERVDI